MLYNSSKPLNEADLQEIEDSIRWYKQKIEQNDNIAKRFNINLSHLKLPEKLEACEQEKFKRSRNT